MPAVEGHANRARRRGRPRQITRERIVSAARTLAPEALTMQAVADVLGVDPKALNYHVGHRDGLRELVAVDAFEVELSRVALPSVGDWRDVLRSYAAALRDATVKLSVLATYFRLPTNGLGALEPVERVLQELVAAGFSVDEAENAAAFEELLNHVVTISNTEPGVIYYGMSQSVEDPTTYAVVEVYRDQEAVAAHGQAPWLAESVSQFLSLIDGLPDLRHYVRPGSAPVVGQLDDLT